MTISPLAEGHIRRAIDAIDAGYRLTAELQSDYVARADRGYLLDALAPDAYADTIEDAVAIANEYVDASQTGQA